MNEAIEDKLFEPNAMSLATVDPEGQPSCRTLLLKDVLDGKFVFYTNYESKKGKQLITNEKAALLFWWREHERQVRIEGTVKKVAWEVSNEYYKKRPEGSQIGAKASPQSRVVQGRNELDDLYAKAEKEFLEGNNECPTYWGGYALEPNLFEFWQGRPNRLHDRLEFKLDNGVWNMVRLAP
jgi:pyridoxamine 5'-phosphate oxidase